MVALKNAKDVSIQRGSHEALSVNCTSGTILFHELKHLAGGVFVEIQQPHLISTSGRENGAGRLSQIYFLIEDDSLFNC